MPPTLYLIDGHALAYRTYYALTRGSPSGFTTRAGEPTAGVFGFASVLLRLLEQDKPEFLAVAFDTGRTFRDDLTILNLRARGRQPPVKRLGFAAGRAMAEPALWKAATRIGSFLPRFLTDILARSWTRERGSLGLAREDFASLWKKRRS